MNLFQVRDNYLKAADEIALLNERLRMANKEIIELKDRVDYYARLLDLSIEYAEDIERKSRVKDPKNVK